MHFNSLKNQILFYELKISTSFHLILQKLLLSQVSKNEEIRDTVTTLTSQCSKENA